MIFFFQQPVIPKQTENALHKQALSLECGIRTVDTTSNGFTPFILINLTGLILGKHRDIYFVDNQKYPSAILCKTGS